MKIRTNFYKNLLFKYFIFVRECFKGKSLVRTLLNIHLSNKKPYSGRGIDQLQNVIDGINESKKTGISSRRLILNAWNPEQINEMALPPCHVLSQFFVQDDTLTCALYQRSGDVGLGIPFNIASYGFLTHLLAKHCGLKARELVHFVGNAHIYDNHISSLREQVIRQPIEPPILKIKEKKRNINDYLFDDFSIKNYEYHEEIKMEMRA